jgi:NADH-quinone oxidoreductase subunit I
MTNAHGHDHGPGGHSHAHGHGHDHSHGHGHGHGAHTHSHDHAGGEAHDHAHPHGVEHEHVHGEGGTPGAPGTTLADRAYLPAVWTGIKLTVQRFLQSKFTVQYPEESTWDRDTEGRGVGQKNPRHRGEHILVKDEEGREKCVACLLCMAACPALCIHIEPEPAPAEWTDRERRPKVFEIDMLRCIYCGYCEEACPCDAIRLTPKLYTPTTSRLERVYGKERLLNNNDEAQVPQRPRK